MKIYVPPIKSQGIKTKLVGWIASHVENIQYDRWVEAFMGTGVVAFNIRPKKALLCDSNPHLIRFYNALKKQRNNKCHRQKPFDCRGKEIIKIRRTTLLRVTKQI